MKRRKPPLTVRKTKNNTSTSSSLPENKLSKIPVFTEKEFMSENRREEIGITIHEENPKLDSTNTSRSVEDQSSSFMENVINKLESDVSASERNVWRAWKEYILRSFAALWRENTGQLGEGKESSKRHATSSSLLPLIPTPNGNTKKTLKNISLTQERQKSMTCTLASKKVKIALKRLRKTTEKSRSFRFSNHKQNTLTDCGNVPIYLETPVDSKGSCSMFRRKQPHGMKQNKSQLRRGNNGFLDECKAKNRAPSVLPSSSLVEACDVSDSNPRFKECSHDKYKNLRSHTAEYHSPYYLREEAKTKSECFVFSRHVKSETSPNLNTLQVHASNGDSYSCSSENLVEKREMCTETAKYNFSFNKLPQNSVVTNDSAQQKGDNLSSKNVEENTKKQTRKRKLWFRRSSVVDIQADEVNTSLCYDYPPSRFTRSKVRLLDQQQDAKENRSAVSERASSSETLRKTQELCITRKSTEMVGKDKFPQNPLSAKNMISMPKITDVDGNKITHGNFKDSENTLMHFSGVKLSLEAKDALQKDISMEKFNPAGMSNRVSNSRTTKELHDVVLYTVDDAGNISQTTLNGASKDLAKESYNPSHLSDSIRPSSHYQYVPKRNIRIHDASCKSNNDSEKKRVLPSEMIPISSKILKNGKHAAVKRRLVFPDPAALDTNQASTSSSNPPIEDFRIPVCEQHKEAAVDSFIHILTNKGTGTYDIRCFSPEDEKQVEKENWQDLLENASSISGKEELAKEQATSLCKDSFSDGESNEQLIQMQNTEDASRETSEALIESRNLSHELDLFFMCNEKSLSEFATHCILESKSNIDESSVQPLTCLTNKSKDSSKFSIKSTNEKELQWEGETLKDRVWLTTENAFRESSKVLHEETNISSQLEMFLSCNKNYIESELAVPLVWQNTEDEFSEISEELNEEIQNICERLDLLDPRDIKSAEPLETNLSSQFEMFLSCDKNNIDSELPVPFILGSETNTGQSSIHPLPAVTNKCNVSLKSTAKSTDEIELHSNLEEATKDLTRRNARFNSSLQNYSDCPAMTVDLNCNRSRTAFDCTTEEKEKSHCLQEIQGRAGFSLQVKADAPVAEMREEVRMIPSEGKSESPAKKRQGEALISSNCDTNNTSHTPNESRTGAKAVTNKRNIRKTSRFLHVLRNKGKEDNVHSARMVDGSTNTDITLSPLAMYEINKIMSEPNRRFESVKEGHPIPSEMKKEVNANGEYFAVSNTRIPFEDREHRLLPAKTKYVRSVSGSRKKSRKILHPPVDKDVMTRTMSNCESSELQFEVSHIPMSQEKAMGQEKPTSDKVESTKIPKTVQVEANVKLKGSRPHSSAKKRREKRRNSLQVLNRKFGIGRKRKSKRVRKSRFRNLVRNVRSTSPRITPVTNLYLNVGNSTKEGGKSRTCVRSFRWEVTDRAISETSQNAKDHKREEIEHLASNRCQHSVKLPQNRRNVSSSSTKLKSKKNMLSCILKNDPKLQENLCDLKNGTSTPVKHFPKPFTKKALPIKNNNKAIPKTNRNQEEKTNVLRGFTRQTDDKKTVTKKRKRKSKQEMNTSQDSILIGHSVSKKKNGSIDKPEKLPPKQEQHSSPSLTTNNMPKRQQRPASRASEGRREAAAMSDSQGNPRPAVLTMPQAGPWRRWVSTRLEDLALDARSPDKGAIWCGVQRAKRQLTARASCPPPPLTHDSSSLSSTESD